MTTKLLPLALLKGACNFDEIAAEWPDGIPLTLKSARRAVEMRLDIDWAAEKLLTASALAEYERVTASALAEYERVTASAWAEYERVTASALLRLYRITKNRRTK